MLKLLHVCLFVFCPCVVVDAGSRSKGHHASPHAATHSGRSKKSNVRERGGESKHRKLLRSTPFKSSFRKVSHPVKYHSVGNSEKHYAVIPQNSSLVSPPSLADNASQAERVREAIQHLWKGYRACAWGHDEVRPISGLPGGKWGNIGMLILDTLDTLWLAELHDEFAEGEKWVRSLSLAGKHSYHTSFFETTIRALGGLLSSFALSGHDVFREKARELGSHLIHVFPDAAQSTQKFAWPAAYLDIRNPEDTEATASWLGKAILADVGSNVIEFSYLSEATGEPHFKSVADANELKLLNLAAKTKRHLAPKFLEARSQAYATADVSVGAYADSYFEYLLKAFIQSGSVERRLFDEWKEAMKEMRSKLLRKSRGGFTFVSLSDRGHMMDHLSCFMGGLLALGAYFSPKEELEDWWLPTGIEITRTCYEMYRVSPSGLAPEVVSIKQKIEPANVGYRVRPETLESLFYLYRITGNETYRQWSSEIFASINKHTRTARGFASARNVMRVPVPLEDSEETFVGAETLKYALLIHLPASSLPLDRFVLNTEAHPLPIVPSSVDPYVFEL